MRTISIQWLGTAGFGIHTEDFQLYIDPYLSRRGLIQTFLCPLRIDTEVVDRYVDSADCILLGHSHYDHIMDVPYIAARHGAKVIGSRTTAQVLRGADVPQAQLVEVNGGEAINAGPFTVRPVKSLHGKPFYGFVPFPGILERPLKKKNIRVWDLKEGGTLSYLIAHPSLTLFYQSGGDLIDSELDGMNVDILLTNISARHRTFTKRLLGLLRPTIVIPCHFDNFFLPYNSGIKYLPTAYFKRFIKELNEVDPGVQLVVLDFFEHYTIPC